MPSTELNTKLTISDQFSAGMRKAEKVAAGFAGRLKKPFGEFGAQIFNLRNAIGAFGVAIGARFAGRVIGSVASTADEIGKLSQRLGVSTEFLSEFRFAAEQTGVDANTLNLALQRVQRRFGEIARTGRGTALPALKELGSDLVVAVQNGQSFEDLLPTIADRLNAVEDPARRLSIAFQLFDSEGAKLVQTLGLGAGEVQKLREEAQALGLTISGDAAASAAEFNNEMNRLRKTFVGFANDAVIPLLPHLRDFASEIREILAGMKELRAERNARILASIGGAPGKGLPANTPFGAGTFEPGRKTPRFFGSGNAPFEFVGPELPATLEASAQGAREFATEIRAINGAASELDTTMGGIRAGLDDLRVQFSAFNVAAGAVNALGNSIANNLSQSITDLATGTKNAKEAFRDLARSIIQDLQRIIIEAVVARALGIALSAGANQGLSGSTFQTETGATVSATQFVQHGALGPAPGGTASFQDGGFVPAGRTQQAVLHGPEVVVPLNRRFASQVGDFGGGRGTTIINISAIDVEDFDRKMAGSMRRQDTTVAGIVANATRNTQQLRGLA